MELLFLFVPIIYVLFFILSCKENKYLKKHEEDEDNFCAPTDFNPANGAPMIGCLDIYGNPYGVSGAVIISESHLAIHTWPEFGYAAVDVFTCGDKINPLTAFDYLEEVFEADRSESFEIPRGMVEKIRKYSPKDLGKITFKPE